MIAETNQFRFPLASAKRGLADDAGRPGSRRSNESSCCVSGKQQQEPWAQFTHTWHPARLQGIALGAGAAVGAGPSEGSAANAIQAGSVLSRKRPGSLGWGPRLQRWTLTPQTDRTRDKEGPAPRAGSAVAAGFPKRGGPCSDDQMHKEDTRVGMDTAGGSELGIQRAVSTLASRSSGRVTLFMYTCLLLAQSGFLLRSE